MIPKHTQNVLDEMSKRQPPSIRLVDGPNCLAVFPRTFFFGVTPFMLVVAYLHQIGTQN